MSNQIYEIHVETIVDNNNDFILSAKLTQMTKEGKEIISVFNDSEEKECVRVIYKIFN